MGVETELHSSKESNDPIVFQDEKYVPPYRRKPTESQDVHKEHKLDLVNIQFKRNTSYKSLENRVKRTKKRLDKKRRQLLRN